MLIVDLEDTIVKPIISDEYVLLYDNIEKIKQFHYKTVYPDTFVYSGFEVLTFSWALWNNIDVDVFKKNQTTLEKLLQFRFTNIYTMLDYINDLKKLTSRNFEDDITFTDYYNKEMILFQLCLNGWRPNTNIYFIDDVVKDCSGRFNNHNTTLSIINLSNINK
jgi:hypothetical protein